MSTDTGRQRARCDIARALALMLAIVAVPRSQATIDVVPAPKAPPAVAARPAAPAMSIVAARADPTATPAQVPTLAVGDRFEFVRTVDRSSQRVGTKFVDEIAAVAPAEYTMATGHRKSRALGSLNATSKGKVTQNFRPAAFPLRFPLTVGKSWTDRWDTSDGDGNFVASVNAQGQVAGTEEVTCAAGTYKTFRVAYTFRSTLADGRVVTGSRTMWYAPEAKYYVRVQYEVVGDGGTVSERWTNELKTLRVASH